MATGRVMAKDVEGYIAGFPPVVRGILRRIRETVRRAAPGAEEVISYGMPAMRQEGMVVYYAAFKSHVGFFPPVRGDAKLVEAVSRYAGPKGNLQFPLVEAIPYGLIGRIVRLRVKQNLAKAKERRRKRK